MNPLAWLDGYKTYIAGVGLIGLGVYQISQGDIETGIKTIGEGLAVIGVGHKLQKAVI